MEVYFYINGWRSTLTEDDWHRLLDALDPEEGINQANPKAVQQHLSYLQFNDPRFKASLGTDKKVWWIYNRMLNSLRAGLQSDPTITNKGTDIPRPPPPSQEDVWPQLDHVDSAAPLPTAHTTAPQAASLSADANTQKKLDNLTNSRAIAARLVDMAGSSERKISERISDIFSVYMMADIAPRHEAHSPPPVILYIYNVPEEALSATQLMVKTLTSTTPLAHIRAIVSAESLDNTLFAGLNSTN